MEGREGERKKKNGRKKVRVKSEEISERRERERGRNLGPNCMKILEIFCLGEERDERFSSSSLSASLSLCSI